MSNISNENSLDRSCSWIKEYESLTELKDFKDNALALFALGLNFGVEDLRAVGADSITDGQDDKKIDMVYTNTEDHYAVIAQCFYSKKTDKPEAKSNKASDLNTGLSWLLTRDEVDLPDTIRSASIELRNGITNGEISKIYVWYVHNLPESKNVQAELKTVEITLTTILKSHYNGTSITPIVEEIGTNRLQELYNSCNTPILVTDKVSLKTFGGYRLSGKNWEAYSTVILAKDISKLYKKHKTALFSANIRDYLGSRNSNGNINYGIKTTIAKESQNFWVYNNGITILTHSFLIEDSQITINGISIVNGAQTTGAIGSSKKVDDEAKVQVKIISVNKQDPDLIQNIIKFNNSQNQVEASDFRSTDKIQKKLKKEFESLKNIEYEAGRRGSFFDKIKRSKKVIDSYYVGQVLIAFHKDPIVAYNKKREIWSNNELYTAAFNEATTADHVIFCYSLVKSIDERYLQIKKKTSKDKNEEKILNFLKYRGAKFLLVFAISKCFETILSKPALNLNKTSFNDISKLQDAIKNWNLLLNKISPFVNKLEDAVKNGLKNKTDIDACIKDFESMLQGMLEMQPAYFDDFKQTVKS